MKNIKNIISKAIIVTLIISLTLCLAGCVRMSVDVNVNEDLTLDMSVLFAAQNFNNVDINANDTVSEEQLKQIKDNGGEVEAYDKDGYIGTKITYKNITVEKLNSAINESVSDEETSIEGISAKFDMQEEKGIITMSFESTSSDNTDNNQMNMNSYIESSGGYVRYSVALPVPMIESNADEVSEDKKLLTWNLLKERPKNDILWVKFKNPKSNNNIIKIILVIAGILIFITLIVVIMVIIIKRKNENKEISEDLDDKDEDEDEDEDCEERFL